MTLRGILRVFVFHLLVNGLYCDYASDEDSLLQTLRTNYSVDHRPSERTTVSSSLVLFALNKLDIGSEVMSLTGILLSEWHDPRLAWNASDHKGIKQMVIPTKYIWTPPLVIENEISKVGLLGSDGAPLRVIDMGVVVWYPPISTTTSCSADVTYYPYDKQTCIVILTGWSYTVDEVEVVTNSETPVKLDFFPGNGEWEILKTGYELINVTTENSTYRKVYFMMTFRRKWQFYGHNVILPIVLNSFLMVTVFVVPIESGEKMGYCLTVLLSYIVLLTMVSDDMPSISSQISVIQVYISTVMCIGTAGTLCTIVVLGLHNKDERKPVPGWLKTITRFFLAPIACGGCKARRVSSGCSKDRLNEMEDTENDFSYKEIAKMIDKIFFRFFAMVMLMFTAGFIYTLTSNY